MKSILLQIGVLGYIVKQFADSIQQPTGWIDNSNNPINSLYTCDESQVSNFFGGLNNNVSKTYTNLPPHYLITFSITILYSSFWDGQSNFFKVFIDDALIFQEASIDSLLFQLDYQYCKANILGLIPMNQKQITVFFEQTHQNLDINIKIVSTYLCSYYSLGTYCEKTFLKNLYLYVSECHETCLTCNGPLLNNCLTCPSGSLISGTCTCYPQLVYAHSCVSACPINYYNFNGNCLQDCSSNCNQCINHKCSECNPSYKLFEGTCVTECPANTVDQSNICQNLIDALPSGGQELGKYFDDVNQNVKDSITPFTYTPNGGSTYSLKTGQVYTYYKNIVMLGGFGVWADGTFSLQYSSLKAHNKLKINLKAYYIDTWNGESFTIKVDGATVYTKSVTSSAQLQNLMFRNGKDLIEDVTLTVNHLADTVTIQFISTLAISSYIGSIGLSDIFIYTQFCDVQCQTCSSTTCTSFISPYQLIATKCILCGDSNHRNIDCSCAFGFYEVNQINCEPCPISCSGCTSAVTCLNCNSIGHFVGLPSCQGCEEQYYKNGNSCTKCIDNCRTCDTSSTCFECYEGYFLDSNYKCPQCPIHCQKCDSTQCLECQPQFGFDSSAQCVSCGQGQVLVDGICKNCNYKCGSCDETLVHCLTCTALRDIATNCDCMMGYYDFNQACELCAQQCSTCEYSASNCLSCAGNRLNAPTCDCPQGGISFLSYGYPQCTTCSVLVVSAKFSDDLTKILVETQLHLIPQGENCDSIFQDSTVKVLGNQPVCSISNNIITIQLGQNSEISTSALLHFKLGTLFFQNCQNSIEQVFDNVLYQPDQLLPPTIQFSTQTVNYKTSGENFQIIKQTLTGNRKLNQLYWRVKQNPSSLDATPIINSLNSQLNKQSIELSGSLKSVNSTFIIATLTYANFLYSMGSTDLEIQIQGSSLSIASNASLPKSPLFRNKQYEIQLFPVILQEQAILNNEENITLTLAIGQPNNLKVLLNQIVKNNEYSTVSFNTSDYDQYNNLQLHLTLTYDTIQEKQSLNYLIIDRVSLLILGGNRQIGFGQQNIITAVVFNTTNINYHIQWVCINATNNGYCESQGSVIELADYQSLQLNEENQQEIQLKIPGFTFKPYEVLELQLTLSDEKNTMTTKATIMTVEDYVPQVKLQMDSQQLNQQINYYDQLSLNYSYTEIDSNPDLLMYVGSFYYNYSLINLQRFYYPSISYSLWDYISTNYYETLDFKFTIYNAQYLMPSSYTIRLSINQPPIQCQVSSNSLNKTFIGLITQLYVVVNDCYDENLPFQYQFVLYVKPADLQFDYKIGKIVQGIVLQRFSYKNEFNNAITGTNESILLVMVKDSLQGIANYTLNLNISNTDQSYKQIESMLNSNESEILNQQLILLFQLVTEDQEDVLEKQYQKLVEMRLDQEYDQEEQMIIFKLMVDVQSHLQIPIPSQNLFNQLNSLQSQLNQFQDTMNQKSDLSYNEHQFQQKKLIERVIESSSCLNSIMKSNSINLSQRRILQQTTDYSQEVNQMPVAQVKQISNLLSQQTSINGQSYSLNYSQYSLQTEKLSPLKLQTKFGEIGNFSQSYQVSQYTYASNPYKSDEFFSNQSDIYPMQDSEFKSTNESEILKNLQSAINYTFSITNTAKIQLLKCSAKINDIWSIDVCKSKELQNYVECQCEKLSPTTIFEAAEELSETFFDIFTLDTISRILNHDFASDMFTYIILVETIIYIWFLYYGHQQDNSMVITNRTSLTKIYPEKSEEQQRLTEKEPKRSNSKFRHQTYTQGQKTQSNQFFAQAIKSNVIIRRKDAQTPEPSKLGMKRQHSIYQIKQTPTFKDVPSLEDEIIQTENLNYFNSSPNSIIRKKLTKYDSPNSIIKVSESKNSPKAQVNFQETITKQNESPDAVIFLNANEDCSTPLSLIQQIQQQKLKWMEGLKLYLKNHHKIAGIYNRFDEKSSRVTRCTMMYISILGSMAVLTFFGKLINLNTIIALSLLQTTFGVTYKMMLSFTIESNNRLVNHIGFNLAFFGFLLFYLVILSGISKYDTSILSVIWGLAYLSNLLLDLVVYSIMVQAMIFYVIVKYKDHKLITKLCQVCISEPEKLFFYGKSIDNVIVQPNEVQIQAK